MTQKDAEAMAERCRRLREVERAVVYRILDCIPVDSLQDFDNYDIEITLADGYGMPA